MRMHNRFFDLSLGIGIGLVVAALSPAISIRAGAQSGTARVSTPDLSGIWDQPRGRITGYEKPAFSITREQPSMTPWAADKWKLTQEGPKRFPFDRGKESWDPSYTHCLPFGPVRPYTNDHVFEIVQSSNEVYILFESDHEVRRVYMDGREHPHGWPFGWMGHSIGKWDGDTLVVDTVGLNDLTWIDTMGHPHSDALHIVERLRRPDRETLQIDFAFDDPKAYPKPWTGKRVFQLAKGSKAEVLEDILCEDHLTSDHLARLLRGDDEP